MPQITQPPFPQVTAANAAAVLGVQDRKAQPETEGIETWRMVPELFEIEVIAKPSPKPRA